MDIAEQLYVAIQHASERLAELDEELGLSPSRFSVLARLRFHGPQHISELARRHRVAQPAMTQLVQGLERAGLVERHGDPADRRVSIVDLAPAGRMVVRRARARKITWINSVLRSLDEQQHVAVMNAARALDDASTDEGDDTRERR